MALFDSWSLLSSEVSKKETATDWRASSGHLSNQSIVQQFIRGGYSRQRRRKLDPAGVVERTMWSFSLTRWRKNSKMASLVSWIPWRTASLFRSKEIRSRSSWSKRMDISPPLRKLVTSSRNSSYKKKLTMKQSVRILTFTGRSWMKLWFSSDGIAVEDMIDHRSYIHNLSSCEIKAWWKKKIKAWTGFEPMTSKIQVQCSTNWAIKPCNPWVSFL